MASSKSHLEIKVVDFPIIQELLKITLEMYLDLPKDQSKKYEIRLKELYQMTSKHNG